MVTIQSIQLLFPDLKGLFYYLDNAVELVKMMEDGRDHATWRDVVESAKVDRDMDNEVMEDAPPTQNLLPVLRYMKANNIQIDVNSCSFEWEKVTGGYNDPSPSDDDDDDEG